MAQLNLNFFVAMCIKPIRVKNQKYDTIAKPTIENDIEPKLQGFEISKIDQIFILKQYLGNRPCKMHWHISIWCYKCSIKLLNGMKLVDFEW